MVGAEEVGVEDHVGEDAEEVVIWIMILESLEGKENYHQLVICKMHQHNMNKQAIL